MSNDEEFLKKVMNGEDITCEDLGIHPNLAKCGTTIESGFRTFYSDGVNYYDVNGNLVTERDKRRCELY